MYINKHFIQLINKFKCLKLSLFFFCGIVKSTLMMMTSSEFIIINKKKC